MSKLALPAHWDISALLDQLAQYGFGFIDHAYDDDFIQQVRQECLAHYPQFREAQIQNGVVSTIRSDHILWIDEQFPFAQQHIQTLYTLAQQLNQAFFFNINEVEAHFACYNAGEFYALHRDNPQQKNDRVISCVYYLHYQWQADWGGELRLQDNQQQWHIFPPQSNRIAVFQSDLLHEVLPAKARRLSITAWLRSTQQFW